MCAYEFFSLAIVPSGNILVSRKFAIKLAKTDRWHRHLYDTISLVLSHQSNADISVVSVICYTVTTSTAIKPVLYKEFV